VFILTVQLNNFLNDDVMQDSDSANNSWSSGRTDEQYNNFSATASNSYGSVPEQNNALYATVSPRATNGSKTYYNGTFGRSVSSDLSASYNAVVKVEQAEDVPEPDYDQEDSNDVADIRTAQPPTAFDTRIQQNRSSVAVNGTHGNSKHVPSPPAPPTFSGASLSNSAPLPPPPPPPPLPASFANVPILDFSTGVPSPRASSGMPRQVQKQLEETRKRDETHAALLAAVQRRRNLLNSVDSEQVGAELMY